MTSDSTSRQPWWVGLGSGLLTALLLVASFHPHDQGWLAFVAPVPWLVALCHPRPWRPLFVSWIVGLVFQGGGLWWIGEVTWLGLALTIQPLALYFLLTGALVRLYHARLGWPLYCFVPPLWVGLEWVRSWMLSGLGWLYIGHTQWSRLSLIQIADLGGAYLVSLVVLLVACAAADLLLARERLHELRVRLACGMGLATLALVASYWYGRHRLAEAEFTVGPRIAVVQGNIPQELKDSGKGLNLREMRDKHVRLTRRAARLRPRPDLIVWAETMLPGSTSIDPAERDLLVRLARESRTRLLIGQNLWLPEAGGADPWRVYNSLIEVGPDGRFGARYDKHRLVPGGEFIPLRETLPWIPEVVRNMVGYVPDAAYGREQTLFEAAGARYGAVICHESIFPELSRALRRRGARFIVNPTNDGWFRTSAELDQVLAICVFRAVENRVAVVRAANTGISAFIDPDGAVRSVLQVDGRTKSVEGVLSSTVYLDRRETLYSRIGDLPAIACLVLAALLALLAIRSVTWRARGADCSRPGDDTALRGDVATR